MQTNTENQTENQTEEQAGNQTGNSTGTVSRCEQETAWWREVRHVGFAAATLAAVTWVLATQVAGVDLVVGTGTAAQHVGLASVVATALVAAFVGGSLLRLLERRTSRGRRTWTVLAVCVLAVSLAGPLGAATLTACVVLAVLHLEVGAVVVGGLRRRAASSRSGA